MNKILTPDEFKQYKRELLLDYSIYSNEAQDLSMGFPIAAKKLVDAEWMAQKSAAVVMRLTNGRADDAIDLLTLNYSAGINLIDLRSFYPLVLEYWQEYAKYSKAYNECPEGKSSNGPHIALRDVEFQIANRLVCFGILLGWGHLLPRLVPITDYNNPVRDGMLERLFAFYVEGRGTPPDECARHLPYFKTLKIFKAPPEQRSELMAEYLEDWYHASRREPYYDSHKRHDVFKGYWSWEAAAITFLLDIDDRSYATAQFYPKDLVDFARSARTAYAPDGAPPLTANELRAKAGEPCPKAGQWESLDLPPQTRQYQQGDVMGDIGSAYGLTVWRYMDTDGR
jgi:hypothetical protein